MMKRFSPKIGNHGKTLTLTTRIQYLEVLATAIRQEKETKIICIGMI